MEQEEMIWLATWAFDKNLDYEQLKYSNYMYGRSEFAADVWEYVEELEEEGRRTFYEKYKDFKLY